MSSDEKNVAVTSTASAETSTSTVVLAANGNVMGECWPLATDMIIMIIADGAHTKRTACSAGSRTGT